MTPRLLEKYRNEVTPAVMQKFGYKNRFQVPRIKKIVINMGINAATHDMKLVEAAQKDMTAIAGQKAVITKAKKAISNFKIRKGLPVGCMVTLRRAKMYEFLDRLINVAIPKIRDFRGVPPGSFDHHGNYTLGLTEQAIFPEIEADKITKTQGMDITITFTITTKEVAYEVLKLLGMPFREA
ncbi:MAG: 50S ribosomal protein L5 [Candidatus Omnitrophica bacterium]|nr:50S ribosomal protein L5 [Candidatus Omnitrophota bacterium]